MNYRKHVIIIISAGGDMKLLKKLLFSWLVLTLLASCEVSTVGSGDDCKALLAEQWNVASCISPSEQWSLTMCAGGGLDCNKQYYVNFDIGERGNPRYYFSNWLIPIVLTSGQIALGDYIGTYGNYGDTAPLPDVIVHWLETKDDHIFDIVCNGKVSGDEMSGLCTQQSFISGLTATSTWRAQKGLVDVENGSFVKDFATGKTRLYFRAWTEDATRVYITADFIDGRIDLVKCGKTNLYMDIWKISNDAACSSEGFYEFPSTSSPLAVQTHIVKPSGEIVREKTVSEGIEVGRTDQTVEFSTVDADSISGIQSFRTILIQDSISWNAFWAEHKQNRIPVPDPPDVDFSQKMIIGVVLGPRPSSCYSVNISSISLVDEQKLTVTYHESTPPENTVCAGVITHPSHIVSIDNSNLPVEFIER